MPLARVVELVDTGDLKSPSPHGEREFESRPGHWTEATKAANPLGSRFPPNHASPVTALALQALLLRADAVGTVATTQDGRPALAFGPQDLVVASEGDQPVRVGVLDVCDGLEQQWPSARHGLGRRGVHGCRPHHSASATVTEWSLVVDQPHGGARSVLVVLCGLAFGSPSAGVGTVSAFHAIHAQDNEPVAVRHLMPS